MCVYTFAFLACIPSLLLSNKKNTEYLALLPIVFHRKSSQKTNNSISSAITFGHKKSSQVFFNDIHLQT